MLQFKAHIQETLCDQSQLQAAFAMASDHICNEILKIAELGALGSTA